MYPWGSFGGNNWLTKICLLAKCIHSSSDDWFKISLSVLLSVADVSDNNIKDDIIILYIVLLVLVAVQLFSNCTVLHSLGHRNIE